MLNERGGIECDLTVTRLAEDAYYIVTGTGYATHDFNWISRHIPDGLDARLIDVTSAYGVLSLMGPKARDVLHAVTVSDVSNAAFPFGTMQEVMIAGVPVRALRVTYVGELGWELYVSSDQTAHVFEALDGAGAEVGLKLCGLHTLDSCRIEKAYRHWGHDITDEDHVLEAGLGFAVSKRKPAFLGREAVLRKQEAGLDRRLVQFRLTDPEPSFFHNEAVVRDGRIVSTVTSGNYGHHLGGAIGMGYVPCKGESTAEMLASAYEIEIAGRRVTAEASLQPMYDPKSERVKL
jgi:4-methylaminobutanoate oxidase (formaldehyde-forming)